MPAARAPAGDTCEATAISTCGCVNGRSWRRASRSVNQSVSMVTVSPRSNGTRAASASSIMSRWRCTSMPIMNASDGSAPGPTPNIHPAARLMIQLHDAVGEHQRMMIRHGRHPGAQLDAPRALRRRGDEDLRRGDDLVAGRVVLADPRLVVAERVEPLDQLEVALQRERRVLVDRVKGSEKDSEVHSLHRHVWPSQSWLVAVREFSRAGSRFYGLDRASASRKRAGCDRPSGNGRRSRHDRRAALAARQPHTKRRAAAHLGVDG